MTRLGSRRGSVMVETALVFSVLMVLALGILDYSRFVHARNLMPQLAREGARWASVRGATSSTPASAAGISRYVKSLAVGIPPNDITVTPTFTGVPGSDVVVETTYNYTPVVGALLKIPTLTVTGQSALRITR